METSAACHFLKASMPVDEVFTAGPESFKQQGRWWSLTMVRQDNKVCNLLICAGGLAPRQPERCLAPARVLGYDKLLARKGFQQSSSQPNFVGLASTDMCALVHDAACCGATSSCSLRSWRASSRGCSRNPEKRTLQSEFCASCSRRCFLARDLMALQHLSLITIRMRCCSLRPQGPLERAGLVKRERLLGLADAALKARL